MESTTATGGRIPWADAAKGVTILFVVLWHVTLKHYQVVDWGIPANILQGWDSVVLALRPLRMPLFFLLSGFFAWRALARPWRATFTKRVMKPYWIYLVWMTLTTIVYAFDPALNIAHGDSLGWWVIGLFVAYSHPWYIYAITAYFVFAKLVRGMPTVPVLVAAAALSLVASINGLIPLPGNTVSIARNLFWFLLGAYLPRLLPAVAASASWVRAAGSAALYGALTVAANSFGLQDAIGVEMLQSLLIVLAALDVLVLICRAESLTRPALWLGSRTMPIYLIHIFLLLALHEVALRLPLDLSHGPGLVVAVLYPLLATTAIVIASLGVERLLLAIRLTWLFELPWRGVPPGPEQRTPTVVVEASVTEQEPDAVEGR